MSTIYKLAGGVEDLTFGLEGEYQTRQGQLVLITQINSDTIPHTTTKSVKDKIDIFDSKNIQYDNLFVSIGNALLAKVDKVPSAVVGNLGMFDEDGNLIDSGLSAITSSYMNLVDPAVEDNLIAMTDLGNSKDSGIPLSEVAKTTTNTFTGVQFETVTAEDNAITFTATNNYELTATAANLTVATMGAKRGQEGVITIHSAENLTGWGAEFVFAPDFSAVTPTPPSAPIGTMEFWYKIQEVNGVDGGTTDVIHIAWAQ